MSITLELTPQEEEWVRNAAMQQGQPTPDFVKAAILQVIAKASESITEDSAGEWDRWSNAGHAATDAARADLRAQGISSVYRRDGTIVEELPDGTIHPVDATR